MSAGNLLSSLRVKPNDESLKDDRKVEGEEDVSRMGRGGGGDPAVLALGPARPALVYQRDYLMRMRNSPLSKQQLDDKLLAKDAFALVLKKRSESPQEDDRGGRGDAPRRGADPRERVRREASPTGGGIVLSPQRRSFTSGCGAPHSRHRPDSPTNNPHNNKPDHGRRIGSGRIMVRDMTTAPWERNQHDDDTDTFRRNERGDRSERTERSERTDRNERNERNDRSERNDRNDDRHARTNGDRYDRRSFTRDSYSSDIKREREERFNNEKNRDRDDNRRSGGRYTQRRFEKEDEPEWFSGGPTSQLETIELRGFDDPAPPTPTPTPANNNNNNKQSNNNNKDNEKWSGNKSDNAKTGSRSPPADRWRGEQPAPQPAAPAADPEQSPNNQLSNDKECSGRDSGMDSKTSEEEPTNNDQADFNLDEFLKFDTIPDVLTNGGGENEGGSRFSRWFQRESPTNESRHYERLLSNIVDDLESPTHTATVPAGGSLLDLLRRAQHHEPPAQLPPNGMVAPTAGMGGGGGGIPMGGGGIPMGGGNIPVGGTKVHSLEELEARLRPGPTHTLPEHDVAAFKRLLAQVSVNNELPRQMAPQPPPQPPLSLLQMLNKSVEQQKAAQPPHIPQDLLYKLLHVQQQQQHQQQSMPEPNIMAGAVERDLLQRPEAQAILHGLKAGEITVQHLMQQLNNPGLQSRHRELLLTILRLHQHHRQVSPSPLPPAAPHLVLPPPHHQPLRLSPLPQTAFCVSPIMATSPNTLAVHHPGVPARIPSPRELAAHTQSIMQGALIKKKLEEQRENYRRRHDAMQHAHRDAPHHASHAAQHPTPISFTPTSVLRKMTAEKEPELPSPKLQQQWSQPAKVPQGRPIVKGNQGGGGPAMGYSLSPAEYQQHYINQQQMISGGRQFPHPQQRQMPPSQLNSIARGVTSNTTLHQLLVQSHQRGLTGGVGAGSGGGDNQLARWFSPELLARASAGKLPSVHVPNALSLEELERKHHSPAHTAPPLLN